MIFSPTPTVKGLQLEFLDFSSSSFILMQVLLKQVISLGVNLSVMVEQNSNSNVIIEIISKTKTKEAIN